LSSASERGGAKGSKSSPRGGDGSGAAIPRLVNVGYGNLISAARVVAVVFPTSSPMRRLREEAGGRGKLIDATQGRRTRSIIVTDSDHVVLSAMNPETISARLWPDDEGAGS
jgi:regulator of extracellular matrix RemA (YlzA/DUF370 family)